MTVESIKKKELLLGELAVSAVHLTDSDKHNLEIKVGRKLNQYLLDNGLRVVAYKRR